MKPDDFADAIRGELSEVRVPSADDALLARIRMSRAAGERVILPLEDARRSRQPMFVVSAIVAAAVVVFAVGRTNTDVGDGLPRNESWLGGDVAYASAPQTRYAGAIVTRADRLRPIQVVYDRSFRDSTGKVTRAESHLDVARDSIDGASVWRLVSRRLKSGSVETDSVWVSERTFAPLRQTIVEAPYSRYERIIVWQRFDGLRVRGEMNAIRGGAVSARRTFDRQLAPSSSPYIADAFVPLFHMGVAIDSAWTGRVSVLGWLVRDDNVSTAINLRVEGEEVVRVPGGTFPCWRLAIERGERVVWYWVRKSDGLGVRVLDTTSVRGAVRETVLRAVR